MVKRVPGDTIPNEKKTQVILEIDSRSTSLGVEQTRPTWKWDAYVRQGQTVVDDESDSRVGAGLEYSALPNHGLTVGLGGALIRSTEMIPVGALNVLSEGGKLEDYILNAGGGIYVTKGRADLSALL